MRFNNNEILRKFIRSNVMKNMKSYSGNLQTENHGKVMKFKNITLAEYDMSNMILYINMQDYQNKHIKNIQRELRLQAQNYLPIEYRIMYASSFTHKNFGDDKNE